MNSLKIELTDEQKLTMGEELRSSKNISSKKLFPTALSILKIIPDLTFPTNNVHKNTLKNWYKGFNSLVKSFEEDNAENKYYGAEKLGYFIMVRTGQHHTGWIKKNYNNANLYGFLYFGIRNNIEGVPNIGIESEIEFDENTERQRPFDNISSLRLDYINFHFNKYKNLSKLPNTITVQLQEEDRYSANIDHITIIPRLNYSPVRIIDLNNKLNIKINDGYDELHIPSTDALFRLMTEPLKNLNK